MAHSEGRITKCVVDQPQLSKTALQIRSSSKTLESSEERDSDLRAVSAIRKPRTSRGIPIAKRELQPRKQHKTFIGTIGVGNDG
jgi:hypothetical protein